MLYVGKEQEKYIFANVTPIPFPLSGVKMLIIHVIEFSILQLAGQMREKTDY